MTDERIKAAAKWLKLDAEFGCRYAPDSQLLDAAHILSLLAEGKAVLCKAEPKGWVGLTGQTVPALYFKAWSEAHPDEGHECFSSLHAPLDPWIET